VKKLTKNQDRLLNAVEREMVEQSYPRFLDHMSPEELITLGRRLRAARDRSRRVTTRTKSCTSCVVTRDNVESARRIAVFVEALKRVAAALRIQIASTSALRDAPNIGDEAAVSRRIAAPTT
jgi:hypothetical protein